MPPTRVRVAGTLEMATDRGQYRALYPRLLNGPSFIALSADARSIFYPLKLRLPAVGIASMPAAYAVLAEDAAIEPERAKQALDELQAQGWIERESNVIWLVRGLEFEPHLNWRDKKHRDYLAAILAALPSVPTLIARFREHYPDWFLGKDLGGSLLGSSEDSPQDSPKGPAKGSDPTKNGSRDAGGTSEDSRRVLSTSSKHKARSIKNSNSNNLVESIDSTGEPIVGVQGDNGNGHGTSLVERRRSALVEQGREALESVVLLAREEANAEHLREEMVSLVFAYWALRRNHPNTQQDPKRERVIRARLRENGNDVNEALYVVDGCKRDKHLMGQNDGNRRYDGIETIFRDRAQVERLAELGGYEPGKIHPQIQALMTQAQQENH